MGVLALGWADEHRLHTPLLGRNQPQFGQRRSANALAAPVAAGALMTLATPSAVLVAHVPQLIIVHLSKSLFSEWV
jgi:hypothetical protein